MESVSIEDYLRILFGLHHDMEDKDNGIRSVDVANSLGITKASISNMMRKLSKEGYVRFKPYSAVFLTSKGLRKGRNVTKRYEVIESFLKNILGYKDNAVHKQAHALEHAFSDESIRRLERFLKDKGVSHQL